MKSIFTLLAALVMTSLHVSAQTFYTVVNQVVPDNGTVVTFDLAVSGLPEVIDTTFGLESVCFNITHTWDSDLQIKLISPDGTSVLLISGVGGDGDNFTNTCLNDFAGLPVSQGSPPFTGSYTPMGDLGLFNNQQDPNGTWKLQCNDTYPQDEGTVLSFEVTFGNEPALPFVFVSSNLPILLINTNGQEIFSEPKIAASLQIIDNGPGMLNHPTDTLFDYEGLIMTELQGFTGPYYPKKNYDFDLVTADSSEMDTVLLGLPAENDFILKAEYLDYSLIKNSISYEMCRRMGRYAPRTVFCEVVLNGEYIGVYTLTEKIKRDLNRVDIASLNPADTSGDALTGGYIIEINENGYPNDWNSLYEAINYATCELPVAYKMVYPKIEEIQDVQLDYIHGYVDSFEIALHGDTFLDSLAGYRRFISVKSFIDFMIVNEFSANYDSYGRSTFLYKEKSTDGGQLHIGPPWDYDRAFTPGTETGWVWEITHLYWPFPFWWSRFRSDPEWVKEVYCRYTDLRGQTLSDPAFDELIDSLKFLLSEPAQRNFIKWAELGVTSHAYYVEETRNFVKDRLHWMDDALAPDAVADPIAGFSMVEVSPQVYQFIPYTAGADYLWDFGDGSSSDDQQPVHAFNTAGEFTVTLTVNQHYGCRASHSETLNVATGLLQPSIESIQCYPAPFHETLTIEWPAAIHDTEISLFNSLGIEVLKQPFTTGQHLILNTRHLAPGMYLLQLRHKSEIYHQALIRQ